MVQSNKQSEEHKSNDEYYDRVFDFVERGKDLSRISQ